MQKASNESCIREHGNAIRPAWSILELTFHKLRCFVILNCIAFNDFLFESEILNYKVQRIFCSIQKFLLIRKIKGNCIRILSEKKLLKSNNNLMLNKHAF